MAFSDQTAHFCQKHWILEEEGREVPEISEIRKAFTDWQSNQRRGQKRRQISKDNSAKNHSKSSGKAQVDAVDNNDSVNEEEIGNSEGDEV